MKNILLTTDLAIETDRAFERAIKLASTLKTKLHILHVCPPYSNSDNKSQKVTLKQTAKDTIQNYLDESIDAKNLKTTIAVIESGEAFIEIINHAEKVKAGLIIMGMHGKSKLRDMFIGTTIERVIRKGIKPVLMVKDKPLKDYKNILVGTDFSAGSKQALHVALELAPNGFFHLFHSYDIPDTYIGDKIMQYAGDVVAKSANDKLENFVRENSKTLKKFGIGSQNFRSWAAQGQVYKCLTDETRAVKSDLIAIGTHGRAGLMFYKLGGTAHDILANPPCDVLIAKEL